jgi:putative ABC transport system permease protein
LLVLILAESFGLSAFGGVIGIGGAWVLFTFGNISAMTGGMFPSFEVTTRIIGLGVLVATALGIIASIAPSIAVARMSVAGGLKTLD